MTANPVYSIAGMLSFTIFSFAYLLRIFELPNFSTSNESNVGLQSFSNALWCIVITLTTVGYGDISPSTFLGRGVAMASALWGAFLISQIVLRANDALNLSYDQDSTMRKIRLTNKAADTIKKSIKLFVAKKRYVKERVKSKYGPGEYPHFCYLLALEEEKSGTFVNSHVHTEHSKIENFKIPDYSESSHNSENDSEVSQVFKERDKVVDSAKLARDCLIAFKELNTTLMEFKRERSSHNTLLYNNSGRKHIIDKMI